MIFHQAFAFTNATVVGCDINTLIYKITFDSAAAALLNGCHLPCGDLPRSTNLLLFGNMSGTVLQGMVGLELYGAVALLRSLAVAESKRGSGLGSDLVHCAEQQAVKHGAKALYLLTTTAEDFFLHLGYTPAKRSDAPIAIASTSEFTVLCPSSSSFMMKWLDSNY